MLRKRQVSRVLEKAELRAAGLKEIDPNLDLGNGCSLKNLTELIEKLRSKMDSYNKALELIDALRIQIKESEQKLNEISERMLMGVALKYGKDSYQYMMAGGVRTSDRIRKSRQTRRRNALKKSAEGTQTA
ncbi:MAG: hypothetical protein RMY36_031905 [Nostoc sp. SerVER01]|nr:hypothetical protein [Nostoc sp. SerVER01]MDZ8025922.1 hypothetical protein [Nostoc sp. DedQUE11]MDZ8071705.1 hypothetical protein [Nostoc sp. DedQUE01]MDZ8082615.1 hypothetical protein [Nostoc sp. DcaGUA01]